MSSAQRGLPPVLERYELKYMIPFSYVEPISRFVEAYCSMDKYSEITPDHFYRVNNLYLDSPMFHFLKMRMEGSDNRFNMRIRSYGDAPTLPFFPEIKQKKSGVVRKYRAVVTDDQWAREFTDPDWIPSESEGSRSKNRDLFRRVHHSYNAEPKVLTQYRRKAYISDCDDYARVTFDIDMRYCEQQSYTVEPRPEKMVHYDHAVNFAPECNVILELKCYTTAVPLWMIDLIKYFDLQRISFSKYMSGIREVFGQYTYDPDTRNAII